MTAATLMKAALRAFREWQRDNPAFIAASLSFFTLFSLVPMMLIGVAIIGHFFAGLGARQQITDFVTMILSPEAAESVRMILQSAQRRHAPLSLLGFFILIWGSSRMFLQFQTALNIIWDVPPSSRGIGGHVRNRLRTLGMTVALALLFLLFFAADFALGIYRRSLGRSLPFYFAHGVIPFFNLALPFALFSGLLAMIYKLLPDRRDIPWRSAWVGAFVSAGLFTVGRSVIGIYFRFSNVASLFGAANSLVVLLLWLYFTMQILLYGAEFSWALTNPVGGHRSVADQTPPEVVS